MTIAGRLFAALLTIVAISWSAGIALAHNNHFVDDTCTGFSSTYFWAGGPAANWYTHTGANKAKNNCHKYTTTVGPNADVVNHANWYLPVGSSYDGLYRVYVRIPGENVSGHFGTTEARYRRYRDGTSGGVTAVYPVNQKSWVNYCVSHGIDFVEPLLTDGPDQFYGSSGAYLKMIDRSNDPGKNIGADYMTFIAHH